MSALVCQGAARPFRRGPASPQELSALGWIRCPLSIGMLVRIRLESVSAFDWITQLPPAQMEGLLASGDRTTAAGRHDRAVLTLMRARLGLRVGEVVRLELGDFDWRRDAGSRLCGEVARLAAGLGIHRRHLETSRTRGRGGVAALPA